MASKNPAYANRHRRQQIRDRWRAIGAECAICHQPIDYDLPKGHPMSFEVDEIVPRRKGGSPIVWENTQPVHRKCNQEKFLMEEGLGNRRKPIAPVETSKEW